MFKIKNTFIIAELSANHNNDFELAVRTIEAMAKSGADAVKLQTYTPDSLTLDVDNEYFKSIKDGLWKGRKLYDIYREGMMPYDWQPKLKRISLDLGLEFFSSPFDIDSVDFLEDKVGVSRYKIASPEITDIPLIEYAASKERPMIISTGLAELRDIELAVNACKKVGNFDITLLKCTTQYPAPFEKANLNTIPNLKETFKVNVGVSDHTLGSTVPVVSVALGATVIEKHFVLDRSSGGLDASFSMEPQEFSNMVKAVREAEKAIGNVDYTVTDDAKLKRRSLFITQDVKKGDIVTRNNIKSVRPGYGLHPKHYKNILKLKFSNNFSKGTPISFDKLSR